MEFLTKEEVEDFRKAFSMFDNDGSGTISSRELITAMQNLNLKPTEDEIESLIKASKTGKINAKCHQRGLFLFSNWTTTAVARSTFRNFCT